VVLDACDKIKAFEEKLVMVNYVKDRQFAPFPTLVSFFVENIFVNSEFLEKVCNHLKMV
jgi:hypothetical protein